MRVLSLPAVVLLMGGCQTQVQQSAMVHTRSQAKPAEIIKVRSIQFSKDGKLLLIGCRHDLTRDNRLLGSVRIYDALTGKMIKTLHVSDPVNNAVSLPKRELLLTSNTQTQVWDWEKGRQLKAMKSANNRGVLAVSADEDLACDGKNVYGVGSWRQQSQLNSKWGPFVRAAAFSPGGNSLVTGAWDVFKGIEAFDARTGRLLWTGNGDCEGNIAWSPSGKVVGAVTTDGLQLYNAADGKLLRKLNNQSGGEITFLSEGKTLAYASEGELVFYEVASGGALKRLPLPKDISYAISPDGSTLAEVSEDGTYVHIRPLRLIS